MKNDSLFSFIERCPTAWHTVATVAERLEGQGFANIREGESWQLEPGGRYYVTRGGSTVAAFSLPKSGGPCGFVIAASHGDSPSFKLKESLTAKGSGYTKLAVEPYGGALYGTWFDRPLSLAGRLLVRAPGGVGTRLVNIDRDLLVLPSVPIHFNREANSKGTVYNAAKDMLPVLSVEKETELLPLVAEAAGCAADDVLSADLRVYCREKPFSAGAGGELVCAPRLDDLQCVFGTLEGFLAASPADGTVPVWVCFDSEEIGSGTMQGADSTFLSDLLRSICDASGLSENDRDAAMHNSFLLSADNAHAVHPNHPELYDADNLTHMNGGVVLKYGPRYGTDGLSAAVVKLCAEHANVPLQAFHNRSDLPGGGTLAVISSSQLSIPAADIGLAQLAMHSACETAGAEDTEHLIRLSQAYFSAQIARERDGFIGFSWDDRGEQRT